MTNKQHIRPLQQFRLTLENKESEKIAPVSIGARTLNEAIANAKILFPRWRVKE